MDGIKQQIQARQMEAMENKHVYNTRKIKREMRAELDTLSDQSKAAISEVKKEYGQKFAEEERNLEVGLIQLRKKNENILKDEQKRYDKLKEELKMSHQQQMVEIKLSQEKEMEKSEIEHKDYLQNLRDKFEAEKARLET